MNLESIFENEAAADAVGAGIAMTGFLIAFYGIILAISIVAYLFSSFGQMGMAKKLGLAKPWLAFIPIANYYQLGKIAERAPTEHPRKYGKILLILYLVVIALSFLIGVLAFMLGFEMGANGDAITTETLTPALAGKVILILLDYFAIMVIAIVASVYQYIAIYKMFKIFSPDNAILFLLLTIFISYSYPIIVFILRNNTPKFGNADQQTEPPTDTTL